MPLDTFKIKYRCTGTRFFMSRAAQVIFESWMSCQYNREANPTPTSRFGVPAARLGLVVDHWTVERLARELSWPVARAMLLGAETYDAAALHRIRFPGGWLFGAMIGSAALHGTGLVGEV